MFSKDTRYYIRGNVLTKENKRLMWLDYDRESLRYNKGKGLKSWLWGKSDVYVVKDKARITSYIEKYLV